ncbi:hypothetical protein F5Y19DRAFT_183222 [Xylariaceae sp. FL1651]|nr:hypothetical protein F5Y19DRAFT_183222 [Xylariaceae sp. FL1651]
MGSYNSKLAVQPIVIISKYSFGDTQSALESTIPPLDLTFRDYIAKGDYAGARAALEALPPLNNFILPPRDFTGLLRAIEASGQAIVYEIGNPLTAAMMAKYNLDITLHTPRRVLLRVEGDKVEFKFNALVPLVAQYGIPEVNAIAKTLDAKLTETLSDIAGHTASKSILISKRKGLNLKRLFEFPSNDAPASNN